MRRIFIGDLHLQDSRPDITEGFIRFLREECLRCDELYILGDLFEAWIGDDERADLSERVAWELQRLRRPGKYFIRGNRDFLIGKDFCDLAGLTLLPDISEVRLGRSSAVILHGDLLCTADRKTGGRSQTRSCRNASLHCPLPSGRGSRPECGKSPGARTR